MKPTAPPIKSKTPFLSVGCVAVSIATIVITLAVVIILVVTIQYSLQAADEFAESYSKNSISAAQNKVNDFVKIPVDSFTTAKMGADYGELENVVNTTNDEVRRQKYLAYMKFMRPMLFTAEFQLLQIAAGMTDGSWMACLISDKTLLTHYCTYNNPVNGTLNSYTANYNATSLTSIVIAPSTFDPRTRSWYTGAPRARNAQPIFSAVYIGRTTGVPVVGINGPLHTTDGIYMGATSIVLDLRQIASFLGGIPRTANGLTALVDDDGLMLGASDQGTLAYSYPYNATLDNPMKHGCAQFTSVTNVVSKVCRPSPATYSSPILQELARKEPQVFAIDKAAFTRKIKLSGEQWMVSKAPVIAKTDIMTATIGWQIYSLMPVSDVTGPIITGRNAGITVGVVMIVVSCVACGVALFVLLRPLSVLSTLMEMAAELKDDSLGATMDKSNMREIRLIQDSFERLIAQLKKAKSFLPAALLAQLESSSDEDETEADLEKNLTTKGPTESCVTSNDGGTTCASSNGRRVGRGAAEHRGPTDSKSATQHTPGNSTSGKKIISSNVSLHSRNVTIAVLNIRNFHHHTSDPSTLEANYGILIDEFQRIAKDHRGILDSFHGDRFTFTFNTVRPCATHAAMAATAMLKIVASMEQKAASGSLLGSSISCGIATGKCLVGNLGSEKAKRYTVIGHAFTHAAVLERLCKRYPNTPILLSAETVKDCDTHIGFLYMDLIEGPTHKHVPIAAAKYLKENSRRKDDEWMYEMAVQSTRCDYYGGNSAFLSALNGDAVSATRGLAAFKIESEEGDWVRGRVMELINSRQPADLGVFFDRCMLEGHEKTYTTVIEFK
eukprot:GILI01000728.1.p1 GENE.GILI01000728.1~~GILI01000728.1.p1  ORF type:complete len:839 (-),score=211.33 GILI01000728.1:453-2969(-)